MKENILKADSGIDATSQTSIGLSGLLEALNDELELIAGGRGRISSEDLTAVARLAMRANAHSYRQHPDVGSLLMADTKEPHQIAAAYLAASLAKIAGSTMPCPFDGSPAQAPLRDAYLQVLSTVGHRQDHQGSGSTSPKRLDSASEVMRLLLEMVVARVELGVSEGGVMLSALLPDMKRAIADYSVAAGDGEEQRRRTAAVLAVSGMSTTALEQDGLRKLLEACATTHDTLSHLVEAGDVPSTVHDRVAEHLQEAGALFSALGLEIEGDAIRPPSGPGV